MGELLIGLCGLVGLVLVVLLEKTTGKSLRIGPLGMIVIGVVICGILLALFSSPQAAMIDPEMKALEDIANGK
jgi:hypothetical protein